MKKNKGEVFAKAVMKETKVTYTENGMKARNTTGDACLDLFSVIGALRITDAWTNKTKIQGHRAESLFAKAVKEDKLLAAKTLFYARDVREGLGERTIPRILFKYAATYHPEVIRPNMGLIGLYGRFDDLYSFIDTPLENDMWSVMKEQFKTDLDNMNNNKPISLLAKWIKTPDASSKKTRELGILTAKKLGYSVYEFKRILRKMRKYIGIVESKMSANEWEKIEYSTLPSRAALLYRNAFNNHDKDRYQKFIQDALEGKVKVNSSTLYPYDITEKILYSAELNKTERASLEASWRNLPNYIDGEKNVLVMADTSGSMMGRPMASALGLAIYFAERNKGAFHNLFMSFSATPNFITLKGETLDQKLRNAAKANWGMNTNIEAAFNKILKTAIDNNLDSNELPEALVIISDMEFDACAMKSMSKDFHKTMKKKFEAHGYKLPNIVFWNVESRNDVFHASKNRKGVMLVSGHSTSTFKNVLACLNMTPMEMMLNTLNSERYEAITVE